MYSWLKNPDGSFTIFRGGRWVALILPGNTYVFTEPDGTEVSIRIPERKKEQ